jgi:hypothetical protein
MLSFGSLACYQGIPFLKCVGKPPINGMSRWSQAISTGGVTSGKEAAKASCFVRRLSCRTNHQGNRPRTGKSLWAAWFSTTYNPRPWPSSREPVSIGNATRDAELCQFQEHRTSEQRHGGMEYRCAATSVTGFVQQLVSCYLPHGYWFYVSGIIPSGKDPESIDQKLIEKYGIGVSRTSRARRKAVGIANVHYIRYERRFLLLATHGFHPFFDDEARSIRDVRRIPIKFEGYSISVAKGGYRRKLAGVSLPVRDDKWRVRVQIESEMFKGLKAYFLDIALHRSARQLAMELCDLPFEPYAPVRRQLLNLIRFINKRRETASLEPLRFSVLRFQRQIVRPFEPIEELPEPVLQVVKAGE